MELIYTLTFYRSRRILMELIYTLTFYRSRRILMDHRMQTGAFQPQQVLDYFSELREQFEQQLVTHPESSQRCQEAQQVGVTDLRE